MEKNTGNVEEQIIDYTALADEISKIILNIDGISSFADVGIKDSIENAIFRRNSIAPGILFDNDDYMLYTLTLHVNVKFGYNIPQLCYDTQSILKRVVEEKFNIRVKAVNIFIEGIE